MSVVRKAHRAVIASIQIGFNPQLQITAAHFASGTLHQSIVLQQVELALASLSTANHSL
jgi:hypothetical protein